MTLPMLCSLSAIDTVLEFLSRNSSSSSSKPFTTSLQFNDLTSSVTPYNLLYEDQVYSTETDILDGLTSFSLPILFLTLYFHQVIHTYDSFISTFSFPVYPSPLNIPLFFW